MKIIHISASYKPAYVYGGPTMSVARLLEELSARSDESAGFDIEVLTTTANGEQELSVTQGEAVSVDGVRVTFYKRLTKDHSHFSPSLAAALLTKIRHHKAKQKRASSPGGLAIHIHGWWNLVSVLSCAIALVTRCRVILSPRGTLSTYSFNNRSSWLKKFFHYLVGRHLLNNCHFHVTTEKERQDILNILNPRSITTIPNIVAGPEKRGRGPERRPGSRTSMKRARRKLLFFSRIEEKKGLDILLRALPEITFPYTLTIAGSGKKEYLADLNRLVRDLKVNHEDIIWIGHQGQAEKFDIYSDHDLLVLPSHDENFGNVVIESLYAGTPVLISDKVGLSSYVESKKLGWICNTTAESVAKTLNEIFDKGLGRLQHISSSCYKAVHSDYNVANIIDQYSSLYQSGNQGR